MLNNGSNVKCGFTGEMVSYIYDEIGTVERREFEAHLTGCASCTDEFAAISNARFSVFEWQKEEFAHLSAPEIVIPYETKHGVEDRTTSAGFLAGLREFLSLTGRPVTVAAVLAVCLGLGFLAMTYVGGNEQIAVVPAVDTKVPSNLPSLDKPKPANDIEITASGKDSEIKPVTAAEINRPRANRQVVSNVHKRKNAIPDRHATQQARKAPVLNNFDDDDDKTLRLTDLFDEVGGGI